MFYEGSKVGCQSKLKAGCVNRRVAQDIPEPMPAIIYPENRICCGPEAQSQDDRGRFIIDFLAGG